MLESILLYIKQGLNAHLRAFSPIIIIEDHIYRLLFTHSIFFATPNYPETMRLRFLFSCSSQNMCCFINNIDARCLTFACFIYHHRFFQILYFQILNLYKAGIMEYRFHSRQNQMLIPVVIIPVSLFLNIV